ncbi:LOW QUALITY PROTEIN: hypothetical protein M8C21_027276, partial [Ambrosia artemisiifolia]
DCFKCLGLGFSTNRDVIVIIDLNSSVCQYCVVRQYMVFKYSTRDKTQIRVILENAFGPVFKLGAMVDSL